MTILPKQSTKNDWNYFWQLGLDTIKGLETEQGILASGKHELYGFIFGRDSLITSLKLLEVYQQTEIEDFLQIVKKVLSTLVTLQGKEVNIESGEEPGKCIHEYRPTRHEQLTKHLKDAWYVYPDNVMRNYDTVDATSLLLITIYRYVQISHDREFLQQVLPNVEAALGWVFVYGDKNRDGFIDYAMHPKRKYGGLTNQNWMDSTESTFHEDGTKIVYPLSPSEAQAYTYFALRLWAHYYAKHNELLSNRLNERADTLKHDFNERYILYDPKYKLHYIASAIDGTGKPLTSVRSSMGHCLWASLDIYNDGEVDGIVQKKYISDIVKRLMLPDMFVPQAGIRTLSSQSNAYSPNSYHNGSIWPHDTAMVTLGLETYGYKKEAAKIREALLKAVAHFKTPIELFVYDTAYKDYLSKTGQRANKLQAWSAAAILQSVAPNYGNRTLAGYLEKAIKTRLKQIEALYIIADKMQVKAPLPKFEPKLKRVINWRLLRLKRLPFRTNNKVVQK